MLRALFNLPFVLILLASLYPARAAEPVTVNIHPNQRHQTLEGFGASGAWWHTWVGNYPQDKQDQLLDLLFTDGSRGAEAPADGPGGIALSIFRYNLPAGGGPEITRPERATTQVEVAPGRFDLAADRKALDLLRGVRQRGVDRFVLFANSPPGRLTLNGLTSGGDNGAPNLRPGAEEDFAHYLVDLATLIAREYDLPHVSLSPINEPQWTWGKDHRMQEGCHYTPEQAAAVIAKVVEVAQRRNPALRIEAPESGAWKGTLPYAQAMFAHPLVDRHVDEIAIHSYWSDRAAKLAAAEELRKAFPTKKLAMTEYCEMRHGHELGLDSALDMAAVIHDDLTIGNVVSWQWWLGVAAGGYRDGLIYAHPETQKIEPTKRLWVLGHYSRFVRPGFTRVAATPSDDRLLATAFASPDASRLVCVVINPTTEPIPLAPAPADGAPRTTTAYVTDATRDLASVAAPLQALPPRSITTLLLDR